MNTNPRAFVSYSWTSPEHEAWVLRLATQLVENGVDVILDKWHLKEGDDSTAFMERMVTDPDVSKVMMICDKAYAEKADRRKSGVGTETQIISAEVYTKVENNTKFVAIIREKDERGKPYVPVYLKNRIFIDLSNEDAETENFEQLVRWIFDKPLHKRPEMGKPPSYLVENSDSKLGTGSKHRLAIEAVKQNKTTAAALVADYLELFAENFSSLSIKYEQGSDFAEKLTTSIEALRVYRDELVDLFIAVSRFLPSTDVFRQIRRFFENMLPYTGSRPLDANQYIEGENDNLRFFLHEVFLYLMAVFIKEERFAEGSEFLSQTYFSQKLAQLEGMQDPAFNFAAFNRYFLFRQFRSRQTVEVEFLQAGATRLDISFEDIKQADFILYLYSVLHLDGTYWAEYSWHPFTNAGSRYRSHPYEVFTRAQSKQYFDRLKLLLSIDTKQPIEDIVEKGKTNHDFIPKFGGGNKLAVDKLANLEKLATKP